uniref:Homoserine kinase n=1 Tax=Eutreptiella gymnastica TaxID=73025 RepID=A0A6T2GMA6_9EUGL
MELSGNFRKSSGSFDKDVWKVPHAVGSPRERDSVTVRVPGTSANLGCGFDCIGMALDIWNELTVERAPRFEILIEGEGEAVLPRDESNLVCKGVQVAFDAAGVKVPPLRYIMKNAVPFARGLGSSSAAIVSGIVAGLILCGHELPVEGEEALLQLAAEIEGHPDNVAPAVYGGLQIGCYSERWHTERVRVPHGLQCILFIPDFASETSSARAILPDKYDKKDCVFNLSRTALLVNSFSTGNLDSLRIACEDRMHQPYRSESNPHLYPLIEAAHDAGAHAAFLSGAGPSVMAFASGLKGDVFSQRQLERTDKLVAQAMLEAAASVGVKGRVFITSPTEKGAHVWAATPPFSETSVKQYGGGSWKEL